MRARGWLLLPRLYLGIVFAVASVGKLTQGADFAGPMSGLLTKVTLKNGYGWYAPFVRTVVLPNAHLFAMLVIAGEAFVAISMLFGLMTRLGAVVAIFLLANYVSAKGVALWSPGSNDVADIVLALVVLCGGAGRICGIDASLAKRFPKVPLW
jgi:uncharacterized membrane protein YphA (DoxX/SURF4 family)